MLLVHLPDKNQMPYLHYEKRCDQAKIHKIIMKVKPRATWEQKLRQTNDQPEKEGSTPLPIDSDADHPSICATSYERLNQSQSPTSEQIACTSEEILRLPTEDEEQSRFLNAEAALIKGYLHGQETLHVSMLDLPCSLTSNLNEAG